MLTIKFYSQILKDTIILYGTICYWVDILHNLVQSAVSNKLRNKTVYTMWMKLSINATQDNFVVTEIPILIDEYMNMNNIIP